MEVTLNSEDIRGGGNQHDVSQGETALEVRIATGVDAANVKSSNMLPTKTPFHDGMKWERYDGSTKCTGATRL